MIYVIERYRIKEMLRDALIGATGFVGSNLRLTRPFAEAYDSANIGNSAGQHFDTVICAAAPGSMIEANSAPERDAATIDEIIGHLSRLKARRMVLISSVAVLAGFGCGQDEDTSDFEQMLAYGRNRRRLEAFCAAEFDRTLILRLPALFGHGLRKNMLFDLMNPVPAMLTPERREVMLATVAPETAVRLMSLYDFNPATAMWHLDRDALDTAGDRQSLEVAVEAAGFEALRFTNPASQFQFFDLSLLSGAIDTAFDAGLSLLHLAPQPLGAQEVVTALRGRPMPSSTARVHVEDMQTKHAALFGRSDRYISDAGQVLDRLRGFVTIRG
jgi:hypothetical protein